mmetsp:Transcript_138121/g.429367  ORF Transcript_138121/g.429367 Transcript_138121/m.429367 type:complete len:271 (-) Transcript_138121:705-1517(-)
MVQIVPCPNCAPTAAITQLKHCTRLASANPLLACAGLITPAYSHYGDKLADQHAASMPAPATASGLACMHCHPAIELGGPERLEGMHCKRAPPRLTTHRAMHRANPQRRLAPAVRHTAPRPALDGTPRPRLAPPASPWHLPLAACASAAGALPAPPPLVPPPRPAQRPRHGAPRHRARPAGTPPKSCGSSRWRRSPPRGGRRPRRAGPPGRGTQEAAPCTRQNARDRPPSGPLRGGKPRARPHKPCACWQSQRRSRRLTARTSQARRRPP